MAGRTGGPFGDLEGLKRIKVKTSIFGQALDKTAMMCYGFIIEQKNYRR